MSIEVNLKISNQNNKDYPLVILRKFFNMVFIEADGKTLQIYTATIFAGSDSESNYQNPYCSSNGEKPCKLNFQYSVENASAVFTFRNLSQSFLAQKDCIEQVWGKCELIKNQTDLVDKIHDYYKDFTISETPGISGLCTVAISEEKNGLTHSCVAQLVNETTGQFNAEDTYTLSGNRFSGLEAIHWIKTTVSIGKNDGSFLEKRVRFNISFEGKMFTPDFTWYFAPPINYIADVGEAEVVHGGITEKNWVSTVADDTTVAFKEWVNDEEIGQRKKVRVNLKPAINSKDYLGLSNQSVSVKIGFSNPKEHENRQFFLGLIVAFLLSFCSDKTRLNDYLSCLNIFCTCTNGCNCDVIINSMGIMMPIIIIMVFISIVLSPKICFPKTLKIRHKLLGITRIFGITSCIILAIYVYGVWNIVPENFWKGIATKLNICTLNSNIIIALLVVSAISNFIYLVYSVGYKKRHILNYL